MLSAGQGGGGQDEQTIASSPFCAKLFSNRPAPPHFSELPEWRPPCQSTVWLSLLGSSVGLLGLAAFWLLQKWSWGPDKSVAQANQWRMVPPPPPPGLQEPIDSLAPDLMHSEPTTTKQPSPSTMPPAPAVDTKDNEDKTTKAGVVPEGAAKPASAPTSTEAEGSAAKESGPEIPDGNLKKWVGQQLEPIRATQRDIVKSLSELLDGQGSTTETNGKLMEKLDKLQMAVDRSLELHKAEAPVQIAEKMGKFQATIDQSIELRKTAAKTADKLSKDLARAHRHLGPPACRHRGSDGRHSGAAPWAQARAGGNLHLPSRPPHTAQGARHGVWQTPYGHFAGNCPDEHQRSITGSQA